MNTPDQNCSASKDLDPNLYCRLCATHGIDNLLAIFSKEGEELNILEKMSSCFPIIVVPEDTMPLGVCGPCLEKLNISYKLLIDTLNAEKSLRTIFTSSLRTDTQVLDGFLFGDPSENSIKEVKCETPSQDGGKDASVNTICEVTLEDGTKHQYTDTVEVNNGNNDNSAPVDEVKEEAGGESFPSLNIYGPVTCDLCGVTFLDMNIFDNHISGEHLMKWQCRLCDDSFDNSADLLAHKVVDHSGDLVSCDMCASAEDDQRDMVEEWLEKPEVNPEFQCQICKKVFLSAHKLKRHCQVHGNLKNAPETHKKQESQTCNRCGKQVSGTLSLIVHKKQHCLFRKKMYRCHICYQSFFRENSFEMHLKNHENKKYTCECGKIFQWYSAFQAHKKTHKPSSLECVTCHKVFTKEVFYKRHRYIHDPEYWDRFKCKTCERPFRDAQTLFNHQQLHAGIKPHMCDLCGRTYNRHANMLKHRKLHKPPHQWEHKCNQCEATYERMRDLMAHMQRSHSTGEENAESDKTSKYGYKQQLRWICRFCGKSISTKLSLQDHERIHTGHKPYICEWCGREFRSRPNLSQHHLTHTGDRKHTCKVCGKRFARKSFITQHMRVHTGEKPFQCNICGNRFTQAGDMRRHWRRHSEVKSDTEYLIAGTVSLESEINS